MAKYSNYNNVLLVQNAVKLLKNTKINEYIIKLKDKQPTFGLIYSLEPVELETLKTYIKINLANNFICLSKSPTEVFILFNKKLNRSLCFYIDFQDSNNLIIKNQY